MKNSLLFMFVIPLVTAFSVPADCNGVAWEASQEIFWTEVESLEGATIAFEQANRPRVSYLDKVEQDYFSIDFIKDKKSDKKSSQSKNSSKQTEKKSKNAHSKKTTKPSKKASKANAKKTSSSFSFSHHKNQVTHRSSQADYQLPQDGR